MCDMIKRSPASFSLLDREGGGGTKMSPMNKPEVSSVLSFELPFIPSLGEGICSGIDGEFLIAPTVSFLWFYEKKNEV